MTYLHNNTEITLERGVGGGGVLSLSLPLSPLTNRTSLTQDTVSSEDCILFTH